MILRTIRKIKMSVSSSIKEQLNKIYSSKQYKSKIIILKGSLKDPFCCFQVIAISLFGLCSLILPYTLNNVSSSALINPANDIAQVKEDACISSKKIVLVDSPQLILINKSSVKSVSPPAVITPQILGMWMGEGDIEERTGITEYFIEDGDSLWSIADKFGVSLNTIFWANDLKSLVIRPGQKLLILPVTGIMHLTKDGETISEIVKKYKADEEETIEYNSLDGRSLMAGEVLIIPGGKLPSTSIASSLSPASTTSTSLSTNNFYGKSHAFPYGQCTYWVAQKRTIPAWGNAINWMGSAQQAGYSVCRGSYCVPQVGAVISLTGHRIYGHVGYVEEVKGDKVMFSEMNYVGLGKMNYRTLRVGSSQIQGYIY